MPNIEELDKNFAVKAVTVEGMVSYDAKKPPFRLYGLYEPESDGPFRRLPEEVAEAASKGVAALCMNTAGARVRFATDSSKIVLTYRLWNMYRGDRMSPSASSCFSLYSDGKFCGFVVPEKLQEGLCRAETNQYAPRKMREIEIYFPLYSGVDGLVISVEEGCTVEAPKPYAIEKPMLVYGGSLIQGASASHPGNAYPAMLGRMFDVNTINLGMSGNARGELSVAEYIGKLSLSAFIMDYDHNSYDIEELRARHQPFFRTFRQYSPDTPVLFITAADACFGSQIKPRQEIIYKTYQDAKVEGDENVYFLDGQTLYSEPGIDLCTVDCVHPNDIGFYFTAKAIAPFVKKMLEKK